MTKGVILEGFEQGYKENIGSSTTNFLLLKKLLCRSAAYREIFLSAISSTWQAPFPESQTKFVLTNTKNQKIYLEIL